jgi:hypothetical protein
MKKVSASLTNVKNKIGKITKLTKKTRKTKITKKVKKVSYDEYKNDNSYNSDEYSDYSDKLTKKNKKISKDDEDLSDIFENIVSFETEINNTKKIAQYKDYLKNIKEKCHQLMVSKKYEIAINELNKEIKKTNDRYVINELLRIMDDLKYEFYSKNPEIDNEFSYPLYYDPNFSQKIYKKAEFYQNKIEKVLPNDIEKIINDRKSGVISLAQHQRFLKNFMSRNTPYNGLLIFHGLGVGKTCAAVQIIEAWLETYPRNEVFLVAPPTIQQGFFRTIFDISKVFNSKSLELNIVHESISKNKIRF